MKPILISFLLKLHAVGLLLSCAIGFINPNWRCYFLGILLQKSLIGFLKDVYPTKFLTTLIMSKVIMLIDKVESWDLLQSALEEFEETQPKAMYVRHAVSAYLINAHVREASVAVKYWCALTIQEIGNDVDQTRSFLQSWVDRKTYEQDFNELLRVKMEQWKMLPADEKKFIPSPRHVLFEERKRTSKYLRYYESHIALELLKELEKRDLQAVDWKQVKHLAGYDLWSLKLPLLKFDEELFLAMGLDKVIFP